MWIPIFTKGEIYQPSPISRNGESGTRQNPGSRASLTTRCGENLPLRDLSFVDQKPTVVSRARPQAAMLGHSVPPARPRDETPANLDEKPRGNSGIGSIIQVPPSLGKKRKTCLALFISPNFTSPPFRPSRKKRSRVLVGIRTISTSHPHKVGPRPIFRPLPLLHSPMDLASAAATPFVSPPAYTTSLQGP